MSKLEFISNEYMNLFKKTGKIEFFMMSRNILKLHNSIFDGVHNVYENAAEYNGEKYDVIIEF